VLSSERTGSSRGQVSAERGRSACPITDVQLKPMGAAAIFFSANSPWVTSSASSLSPRRAALPLRDTAQLPLPSWACCSCSLADNGIRLTGHDAPAAVRGIEIRCAAAEPGADRSGVRNTVRDHGRGIHRRRRRGALALFRRLTNEATRETKGTGIGLALVERLMRAMGARVELHDGAPGPEVRLVLRAASPGRLQLLRLSCARPALSAVGGHEERVYPRRAALKRHAASGALADEQRPWHSWQVSAFGLDTWRCRT
jgi:hypothetical protein